MNKGKIDNKRLIYVLFGVVGATLVGIIHTWSAGTENLDLFFSLFAGLYGVLIFISAVLAFKLKGRYRVLACLNILIASLVFAYDLFFLALGAMQF